MAKAKRRHILTVGNSGDAWRGIVIPGIRIQRKCVERAGFHPGDKVGVSRYSET
jgi:hypothetical protein